MIPTSRRSARGRRTYRPAWLALLIPLFIGVGACAHSTPRNTDTPAPLADKLIGIKLNLGQTEPIVQWDPACGPSTHNLLWQWDGDETIVSWRVVFTKSPFMQQQLEVTSLPNNPTAPRGHPLANQGLDPSYKYEVFVRVQDGGPELHLDPEIVIVDPGTLKVNGRRPCW